MRTRALIVVCFDLLALIWAPSYIETGVLRKRARRLVYKSAAL